MRVISQHRQSRQWIESWIRAGYATNWRVRLLYQWGAYRRLWATGWPAFKLKPGDFVCPDERDSPEAIRGLLEAVWRVR